MNHKILDYSDNMAVLGSNEKDTERLAQTLIRETEQSYLQENENKAN